MSFDLTSGQDSMARRAYNSLILFSDQCRIMCLQNHQNADIQMLTAMDGSASALQAKSMFGGLMLISFTPGNADQQLIADSAFPKKEAVGSRLVFLMKDDVLQDPSGEDYQEAVLWNTKICSLRLLSGEMETHNRKRRLLIELCLRMLNFRSCLLGFTHS